MTANMNCSDVRGAFVKLKPLCDKFAKSPHVSNLSAVMSQCESLRDSVLQEIHTYVLYPFTVHLSKATPGIENRDDLQLALVRGMANIFHRTQVENVDHFLKYFSVLICQIFDKNSHDKVVANLDEDLALSVVKAVTEMTLRLPRDTVNKLYSRRNAPQLGHGIYLCVQIAKNQRYRTLRINALQCILALSTVHEDQMKAFHLPSLNRDLCERVGDVLMFFLPGLMGALQEIAKGEEKQGRFLTCLAIQGIRSILCLVMMDQCFKEVSDLTDNRFANVIASYGYKPRPPPGTDPFGLKLRSRGDEGMMEHLERAERNEEWFRAAGEKLTTLLMSLVPLRSHPQSCVRLETGLMCSDIVKYCPRNMHPSLKYILDILIALSEEDDPRIVEVCREALKRFASNVSVNDGKLFVHIVEDGFVSLLKKTRSYLYCFDASKQISELNLLKGYLRLLSSPDSSLQKLTQILSSSAMLNRFTVILLDIFKMECSSIKLTEESVIIDVENNVLATNICPWQVFTFLDNPENLRSALQICEILGRCEAVHLIVDHLLDNFKRHHDHKNEIIFILNEICAAPQHSVTQDEFETKENLIKNVIATYLEPENWYPPTGVCRQGRTPGRDETLDIGIYNPREWKSERTPGLYEGGVDIRYTDLGYDRPDCAEDIYGTDEDYCSTVWEAQNNITKICLMTEGVGKMAIALRDRPACTQQYLQKSLYLILERAGSSNEAVRLSGVAALSHLAEACQSDGIPLLIKENADYFTHEANMKLKKINDNGKVLDVLLVVMKYGDAPLLPCLYDIVSNVLQRCSQRTGNGSITMFLKLFYTFIKFVKSKYFISEESPDNTLSVSNTGAALPSLLDFKNCKYMKFEVHEEILTERSLIEKGHNDVDWPDDENKSPDPHIAMIVSVLKSVLNFIPSNDRDQQLSALDVFREGITAIRNQEDDLLPLVHAVWSLLVNRLRETFRPSVVIASFRLLVSLADVSKDFIRVRTQNDVLPLICEYLLKSSKDSNTKRDGSAYTLTQGYRLQACYLQGLGDLCVSLNLQEKEIYRIMLATQPYLSCKQPKSLQMACLELYKLLMKHNLPACWLHIKTLWNEETESFAKKPYFLNFTCSNETSHFKFDYQKNVTMLLKYKN